MNRDSVLSSLEQPIIGHLEKMTLARKQAKGKSGEIQMINLVKFIDTYCERYKVNMNNEQKHFCVTILETAKDLGVDLSRTVSNGNLFGDLYYKPNSIPKFRDAFLGFRIDKVPLNVVEVKAVVYRQKMDDRKVTDDLDEILESMRLFVKEFKDREKKERFALLEELCIRL